jgi:hypothetical protein
MHLVGYFEGIASERGLEWRCSDSLSLREFLRLAPREHVPDHSWLSRTRARLPLEVHGAVFDWVLARLAEHGLIRGERIGVDASTMEANAALRTIVRRDSGETYHQMLHRMAEESGIATPAADDLVRLDRARKGKKLSNDDWTSPVDPDARITKMKDGTTHLAYKPEHAVDLDTGAIVAAEVHSADRGDTNTLPDTLTPAEARLRALGRAPSADAPAELVADKGYHSREVLKCQSARNRDPGSASNRDPSAGMRVGARASSSRSRRRSIELAREAGCEGDQARVLKRQLSLPVSTMSQW